MSSALPPQHPDDDLLADLAADVLPTHQARAVESHVMACGRCSALLTDAEQVRNLLLRDDPGPIPADVIARIDAALRIEVTARDGYAEYSVPDAPTPAPEHILPNPPAPSPGVAPATPPAADPPAPPGTPAPAKRNSTQPVRIVTPWDDTTTIEAYEAARKRQSARRPGGEDAGSVTGTSAIPAAPGRGPRLTRPSRGPSRSRKDLREEVRDLKSGRRGMVLAGAAGAAVILGLGGYVVVGLIGTHESDSAASAASSVEAAGTPVTGTPGGPPVLTSGTNYTGTGLAQQARTLVAQVDRAPGPRGLTVPRNAAPTRPQASASGTPGDAGDLTLRSPAALQGCLQALQAQGQRPVAVDLARYEGRDAAIIVLNGKNGGYEVWAVARNCRPGDDGTINYLVLPQ